MIFSHTQHILFLWLLVYIVCVCVCVCKRDRQRETEEGEREMVDEGVGMTKRRNTERTGKVQLGQYKLLI